MKFSKETIEILKNLSTINLNILFKEGNRLLTKNPPNTIIADIEIQEKFEEE